MVAFVFTSLLGVTWGIVISIITSMLLLIKYQARPAAKVLGVLRGTTDMCVDVKQFTDAHELEGIKIFQFQAPLHFANKDHFEAKIRKMEGRCQWNSLNVVIVDCASINNIDITCIKMLERLQKRYASMKIDLIFANWRGRDMRDLLDRSGFYDMIDPSKFYLDMAPALEYAKMTVREIAMASPEGAEMVSLTAKETIV